MEELYIYGLESEELLDIIELNNGTITKLQSIANEQQLTIDELLTNIITNAVNQNDIK